jgi:hypothetical protein
MNSDHPFFDAMRFVESVGVKDDDQFVFIRNGKVEATFTGAMLLLNLKNQLGSYNNSQAGLKKKAEDITLRAANN